MTYTWVRLKAFPDGLTYFKCSEFPHRIYVADQSGSTPTSCQDGPQYLTWKMSADWKNVSAEVMNERGDVSVTPLGFDEALWLAMHIGTTISTKYGEYRVLTDDQLTELQRER